MTCIKKNKKKGIALLKKKAKNLQFLFKTTIFAPNLNS